MRTGHLLAARAAGYEPVTVDIRGNKATNGEYLFPIANGILGMGGLGGIGMPEMVEVDLTKTALPFFFSSMPWTLDRRLSPGGCKGVCESTPQPLDPDPFEGLDPRTEASNIPTGRYYDPMFTAAPLSDVRNRILSYVTRIGDTEPPVYDFNGDASVLAWPPNDPAALQVLATPEVKFCAKGSATGTTGCMQAVSPPACSAPLVLQNGSCVRATIVEEADPPPAQPVFAAQTTPVTPPPAVLPAVDTVTISSVVWVPIGGLRGLRVIAKTSQPGTPVPTLFVTAFNGTTVLLPQTAMTLSTTPIATDTGAVQCSVADPCWQLPLTRLPKDVKPTSVVVQSSKLGTATALPTNNQSF